MHHEGASFRQKAFLLIDFQKKQFDFFHTNTYDLELFDLVEDLVKLHSDCGSDHERFEPKTFINKKVIKEFIGNYCDSNLKPALRLTFKRGRIVLVNKQIGQVLFFFTDGNRFKSIHRNIFLNLKSDGVIELDVYGNLIKFTKKS